MTRATQTTNRPATTTKPSPLEQALRNTPTATLLESILDRPVSERARAIDESLQSRIEKIEELLPAHMKGQGARLAKRAAMYFNENSSLQNCPPTDFIRCVLEAAEAGFAIDGKMCYVLKYNGDKGRWQLVFDYKALVATARRIGYIKDIYGDVVCENDTFNYERANNVDTIYHQPALRNRGECIAAYMVITLPVGGYRVELMNRDELDAIQLLAPAKNGPWKTFPNEQRKKTVVRRALKMYRDDPAMARVLDNLGDELPPITNSVPTPRRRSELNDSLPPPAHETAEPESTGASSDEPVPTLRQMLRDLDACATAEDLGRIRRRFADVALSEEDDATWTAALEEKGATVQ